MFQDLRKSSECDRSAASFVSFRKEEHVSKVFAALLFLPSFVCPNRYLMATAASVLIESQEVPAKEVLRDVADMTKGFSFVFIAFLYVVMIGSVALFP